MPAGGGKYDELAMSVRQKSSARTVVVLIIDGLLGDGFSCCSSEKEDIRCLPSLLRSMADSIESDVQGGELNKTKSSGESEGENT